MTLSTLRALIRPAAADRGRSTSRRRSGRRRAGLFAGLLAGLALLGGGMPALATIVYSNASVCEGYYGDDCANGPSAIWTPPNGALVSTSASHAWSDSTSIGDTFSLTGAAQSSVSGVNHWSGSASAGGYINFSYYNHNAITSTATTFIEDEYLIPSTPTWSGLGFLALTYHLTGDASVSYDYVGHSSNPGDVAAAKLTFLCYSTVLGPCTATGLDFESTGTYGDALSSTFDDLVTLFFPVASDVAGFYQFRSILTAGLGLYGDADPTFIEGGASADFSHTFQLVDADLLDSSMMSVPDWSITSGSGFDYAHIATVVTPPPSGGSVPEPATFALLGLGGLCARFAKRKKG